MSWRAVAGVSQRWETEVGEGFVGGDGALGDRIIFGGVV